MVIQSRTETQRNRVLYFLTFILSITVLIGVFRQYAQSSTAMQAVLIVLGAAAAAATLIAILQLFAFPKRSHALIIQRDGDMIIATNAVHEGFKLRFLRDVLNEHVFVFSDEDRNRLKSLETDGYYPAMLVRDVRKVLLLRLREDEKERLGDRFSLRGFHDALLREGSLPISFHRRLLAARPS